MRIIYDADDALDAYMAKAVLQEYGIESHVLGEYLQGGIGDLPTSGLVKLAVADDDAAEAEEILRERDLI